MARVGKEVVRRISDLIDPVRFYTRNETPLDPAPTVYPRFGFRPEILRFGAGVVYVPGIRVSKVVCGVFPDMKFLFSEVSRDKFPASRARLRAIHGKYPDIEAQSNQVPLFSAQLMGVENWTSSKITKAWVV